MLARINMTIRRNILDSLAIPHRRCLSPVRLKQWASQVEGGIHHTVGKHRFLTILKIMTKLANIDSACNPRGKIHASSEHA